MSNSIQVFEYGKLLIGTQGFQEKHFDKLVRYNDTHGCKYFDVGHKHIRFKQYVGVIQVGKLVIEILPKADAEGDPSKQKWQQALIEMLRKAGWLRLDSMSNAMLRLRSASLLDLYIESFLSEVKRISHEGLTRRYRKEVGNINSLKGKLLFSKHISENLIHKERFFTEHVLYDQNNIFNQIVKAALSVVARSGSNPHLMADAETLLLYFEEITPNKKITADMFGRLRFGRNTERYRYALQLAKLILLDYLPDLRGGRESVLAILFNMNELFERYVFVQLKRAQHKHRDMRLRFMKQTSRLFWGKKHIRPDIVAEYTFGNSKQRMIIDTKWKVLLNVLPSDEDLRQMYAYNLHFGADKAILLYPLAGSQADVFHRYAEGMALPKEYCHGCGLHFAELFDDKDNLRNDIGDSLIKRILVNNDSLEN